MGAENRKQEPPKEPEQKAVPLTNFANYRSFGKVEPLAVEPKQEQKKKKEVPKFNNFNSLSRGPDNKKAEADDSTLKNFNSLQKAYDSDLKKHNNDPAASN